MSESYNAHHIPAAEIHGPFPQGNRYLHLHRTLCRAVEGTAREKENERRGTRREKRDTCEIDLQLGICDKPTSVGSASVACGIVKRQGTHSYSRKIIFKKFAKLGEIPLAQLPNLAYHNIVTVAGVLSRSDFQSNSPVSLRSTVTACRGVQAIFLP